MEMSPTRPQHRSGKTHLIACLQEKDVERTLSINVDSVELDVIDDRANDKRVMGTWDHFS
jgi:hypothetical protein